MFFAFPSKSQYWEAYNFEIELIEHGNKYFDYSIIVLTGKFTIACVYERV